MSTSLEAVLDKFKCPFCVFIVNNLDKVKSGTGVVTCRCGVEHKVMKEYLGARGAPEYITGRYRRVDLFKKAWLPPQGRSFEALKRRASRG